MALVSLQGGVSGTSWRGWHSLSEWPPEPTPCSLAERLGWDSAGGFTRGPAPGYLYFPTIAQTAEEEKDMGRGHACESHARESIAQAWIQTGKFYFQVSSNRKSPKRQQK